MRRLTSCIVLFSFVLMAGAWNVTAVQNIKVNPDGVNVNVSGATVVFLSFGPLVNRVPAEGCWCGELIPAAPDFGFKCDPATIFGCLPARLDLSTRSGAGGFTDIMSIPPSVSRRAYQAAQEGATSSFFYVRRFINPSGGPDEFVAVTCRMTGGGARTPFSLTDVKLSFESDKPILLVKPGAKIPRVKADIAYNGTGRLKGRWEVVLPGEEPPSERDLLTEATLPVEERGRQRRFTQLSRFNVFLPPTGKYVLAGPDPSRLPAEVEGQYLILLRIEASDDKEGDSNLSVVEAGPGVVHSGAVAGFPLPPLRYYVGSNGTGPGTGTGVVGPRAVSPEDNSEARSGDTLDFQWSDGEGAAFYRIDIADLRERIVLSAIFPPGVGKYRAPSWLKDKVKDGLRWRVVALDEGGSVTAETPWRKLIFRDRPR
jgi:hypothetical protein